MQLTAVVRTGSGDILSNSVTFSSSASTIATVSSAGLITAMGPVGTANISATSGSIVSNPVTVTVTAAAASALVKSADLIASPVAASANNISVKVTDAFGNVVAGTVVTFAVTAGGGSVIPSVATTGATGLATTSFKLGNAIGLNNATATAAGLTGSPLTFSATSAAGAAASITKISTDPTSVAAGAPFGSDVRVAVADAGGNLKAGVAVTFVVTAGGGSITPASVTTGANGQAAAVFTTGTTAGVNTATATVAGLTPVSFSGATVTPTVTGSWTGVLVLPSGDPLKVAMTLTQTGSTITGSGTADSNSPPVSIYNVTGTVTGTAVAMTFNILPQQYNGQTVDANEPPATFSGTLTATTMTGLVNKAASPGANNAIVNTTLTLTKK